MPSNKRRGPAAQELIWLRPERERVPRPSLSRASITKTAVELADAQGLDAVTIRKVATALGAGANSLYSYITSKDDLYELMADEVTGEVTLPTPTGDWRADLAAIARNTRDVLARHRWVALLGIQPGLGPKTRHYGQAAMQILAGLGLDQATLTNILATLNNYLYGFCHREAAWAQLQQRSGLTEHQWENQLDTLVEQAKEHDPDLGQQMLIRLHLAGEQSFEFGLTCLLDGITALAHRHQNQQAPPSNPGSD